MLKLIMCILIVNLYCYSATLIGISESNAMKSYDTLNNRYLIHTLSDDSLIYVSFISNTFLLSDTCKRYVKNEILRPDYTLVSQLTPSGDDSNYNSGLDISLILVARDYLARNNIQIDTLLFLTNNLSTNVDVEREVFREDYKESNIILLWYSDNAIPSIPNVSRVATFLDLSIKCFPPFGAVRSGITVMHLTHSQFSLLYQGRHYAVSGRSARIKGFNRKRQSISRR